MDVKVKIEHEEVDLPDLIDPELLSDEQVALKHEIHTCSECLEDFNCEFLLKVHQMIHDKTQYCFICKCTIHNNFKEHVMDQHFNQCNVCLKNFNHKRSLASHMELHTGNLKYLKCDKCDKMFRQRGSLYSHMRSYHEGLKPFACKETDTLDTNISPDQEEVDSEITDSLRSSILENAQNIPSNFGKDTKNEYASFGEHIANKLRKYDDYTRSQAEMKITQILYDCDMELYRKRRLSTCTPLQSPDNGSRSGAQHN